MLLKHGPYSPSRLETALCGYTFNRQYVDKDNRVKRVEGLPQARGSAVHEVLELVTAELVKGEEGRIFSEAEIRQRVAEAVDRHPAAYPEAGDIVRMVKLYMRKPPKVLTSDAGIELKLAVKATPGSGGELDFEECDYNDPEAFFRGRADILVISDDMKSAIVYDHKTQPNIEEADTFQMGCYAWVIQKIHPYLERIDTVLHLARYGVYSDPYCWTTADLLRVEDEILTRVQIVENRTEWPAIPNKLCQYCPVIMECPAMKDVIEIEGGDWRVKDKNFEIMGDTQKAVRMAGIVNVLEEILSLGKKSLKSHVNEYGPIAIAGKVYEFRGKEAVDWTAVNKKYRSTLYDIFEKHGVDAKSFMAFGETASKAAFLVDKPDLVKDLSDVVPRKVNNTFRGYKS